MANRLKTLREAKGMTQENVAELMDISQSTLQNWEKEGYNISANSLHELLDIYKVNDRERNEIVLEFFGDSREKQVEEVYNFPDFLYESVCPEVIERARRIVISAEEMELFGYFNYVNRNGYHVNYQDYLYFGGFYPTYSKLGDIKSRIYGYRNGDPNYNFNELTRVINNFGHLNPNKGCSFCAMSKYAIAEVTDKLHNPEIECDRYAQRKSASLLKLHEYCEIIGDGYCLGSAVLNERHSLKVPDFLKDFIDIRTDYNYRLESVELNFNSLYKQCFVLRRVELEDEEYQAKKKKYIEAKEMYEAHPELYDRRPQFQEVREYWLHLSPIGEKFLEWGRSE